jgi:uncharacterized surface protein with fasciclin (FAS1) repeats
MTLRPSVNFTVKQIDVHYSESRHCAGEVPDAGGAANLGAATADQDIVDTAVAAGSFKTLVTALQAADLVETLKGAGGANVKTDIAATNGVIHLIDSVILPKDE